MDMFKYSALFSKKGSMVFISHLDLMKLFRRAIRRAELPFVLTGGFTPRIKVSFQRALKLGVESENEEMKFTLAEDRPPEEVMAVLNSQMPGGVKIFNMKRI